jgi:hypothetical protein
MVIPIMKRKRALFLFVLMLFLETPLWSQEDDHTGFYFSHDLTFGLPDKVLRSGLGRKITLGIAFNDRNKHSVFSLGVGIKGFKIDLFSPKMQDSFLADVKAHYVPVSTGGMDSLVGVCMNGLASSSPGFTFWGTYSFFLNAGFKLNTRFWPSLVYYYGAERHLLFGEVLRGKDPNDPDFRFIDLYTTYHELKVGFSPLWSLHDSRFTLYIYAGYRWVNYGNFDLNNVVLSTYTQGMDIDHYRRTGKFVFSISVAFWNKFNG